MILQKDFHEFYNYYIQYKPNIDLFNRMKVLDSNGNFSKEEWEVAGIYLAFVFRKKGDDDHDTPTNSPYSSPHTSHYSSPSSSSQRYRHNQRGGSSRNHRLPSNRHHPYHRPPNNNRPLPPPHGFDHAPPPHNQDFRRNEKPYPGEGGEDYDVPPPK